MKIHYYGIVWNEAPWLPYFFRHYDPWIERYTFFDNGSNDGTRDMLQMHPRVELRSFVAEADSIVETAQQIKSEVWQESRGRTDLVLVCDVDELLWHPHFRPFLEKSLAEGITIFRPAGWQMVHDRFPETLEQVYDEVRCGFRATGFDKPCLFDPNRIEEIRYTPGCHTANPTGKVVWSKATDLRLLHFKYMGIPYVAARYAVLQARLRRRDHEHDWGAEYRLTEREVRELFASFTLETLPLDTKD